MSALLILYFYQCLFFSRLPSLKHRSPDQKHRKLSSLTLKQFFFWAPPHNTYSWYTLRGAGCSATMGRHEAYLQP